MKRLLLLIAFLTPAILLLAQNRTIKGRVTDEAGNPIPNASVTVKETRQGGTADANGNYLITVDSRAKTLLFSFVGKATEEVSIGNKSTINVTLRQESTALEEVVVTGYQSIARRDVSGSVSKIKGTAIADKPSTSFDQLLGGKAPGLQVSTSSGLIGDNVVIRIRGAASINSGSNPLIIMDGVPLQQGNDGQLYNPVNVLQDVNPNDIESVEVLKDASAAAIYGSRAAGGVILITTKKGRAGQTKINYDMFMGYNDPSNRMKVLGTPDYTSVINTMRENAGLGDAAKPGDFNGDGQPDVVNTDWQDEVYHKGFTQQQNVSMSGGNDRSTYFASLNYTDFQNYIINNRLRRGSARLNATTKVGNWLTFGMNNQFSRTFQYGLGSGTGNAASGIPLDPLLYFPNVPVRDMNGNFYLGQGGNSFGMGVLPNPVAVLLANFDNREDYTYIGSFYGEAQIIKGLKFKSQYNVDFQTSFGDQFWGPDYGDGQGLGGLAQTVNTQRKTWSWFNTLTYNTKIAGVHDINALGGFEYTRDKGFGEYAYGIGLNDPSLPILSETNYQLTGADNYSITEYGLASYFGTVNYGYKNKYLATFNFRADASSRFGKDNQFGYFPAGSVAWRLSEENFMKNIKAISDAKLRASYGVVGNDLIGDFTYNSVYGQVQYADVTGFARANPGNSSLRWEKQKQLDIGLDFTLWNKVNITTDYYNRRTQDLILNNPVLATVGFPGNSIVENIGQLKNSGIELGINSTNISRKNFTWTTNFNIAYSKSKVVSTNSAGDDLFGGFGIARPGVDLGTYYLIRWNGVNPQTGWATWLDGNGNVKQYDPSATTKKWTTVKTGDSTGAITAADRVVLKGKTPYPKFYGGLSNSITFKGFDFSFDLQYAFGFYVYNSTLSSLVTYTTQRNKSTELLNAWTTAGQVTNVPKLYWGDNQESQASSRFLEKGDYVRVKNIALGYTLPRSIVQKMRLSSLRIYIQAQNLHTFTGYKGIDPEANANGNTNIGLGVDQFRPYLARTISAGLNVSF